MLLDIFIDKGSESIIYSNNNNNTTGYNPIVPEGIEDISKYDKPEVFSLFSVYHNNRLLNYGDLVTLENEKIELTIKESKYYESLKNKKIYVMSPDINGDNVLSEKIIANYIVSLNSNLNNYTVKAADNSNSKCSSLPCTITLTRHDVNADQNITIFEVKRSSDNNKTGEFKLKIFKETQK